MKKIVAGEVIGSCWWHTADQSIFKLYKNQQQNLSLNNSNCQRYLSSRWLMALTVCCQTSAAQSTVAYSDGMCQAVGNLLLHFQQLCGNCITLGHIITLIIMAIAVASQDDDNKAIAIDVDCCLMHQLLIMRPLQCEP